MSELDIRINIFDMTVMLHKALFLKKKTKYQLCLTTIEDLNKDYKSLMGKNYIDNDKIIKYYELLWSVKWID